MSQDLIGLNGGGGNVDSTVTNDAHLVVLIGQTNSSDEVKLTLSLLNAALAQIGKPVQEHLTDIVNAIRHKQYEKSSYDQQQRIGYSNDVNFTFELLVNPLVRSVRQSFKNALTSDRKLKYVVNLSGDRAIQGDVNCSDASISCDDLLIMLGDAAEFTDEQRKALKSAQKSFTLLVPQRVLEASRSWKAALEKQYTSISVQPINTATAANENVELNESLTQLLNQTPIDQLLVTPPYTGTLKVTRPSLYIFPSEQGDAAYFALNGYSMLINGGYDRLRPSFWKFVNLLQQIDSVLLTHADVDALGGLVGLFGKKAADTAAECKPQVLTLLGNFVRSNTKPQADIPTIKTDVDVILDAVEKLNVRLMPLVKTNENLLLPFNKSTSVPNKYEHINLYSKLGHGSLDLYVLSPFVNSPEYKEFYLQQQQSFARQTSASANLQKAHLAVHGVYKHLPLSHLATSVCLLVWLPAAPTHRQSAADPAHNALRLLFTGNAPQHVILNALDKLKDFELLNEPIYRVKPEPAPHQPIQSLKKQTSASGVGGKTESSSTNGKLNTSISSKPVGTANGHHTDHHDEKEKDIKQPIKSSKPPVPSSSSTHNTTAAAAKPSQPATKSTTTKSTSASSALNTSVSKDVKDGAASGKHEKKPPVNNSASSQAKKKPEHSEDKEKSGTDKVVTASSEKPKEAAKKTGPVGKKETPATNGSGPVKSETSTNSRASLSKAADNKEKEKPEKPEAKPPVPKQQPAKSSTTASKPPAGDAKHESKDKPSGHKTETKPDSGKKSLPSSKPPSTTAATKKTSTGGAAAPKTLTLSMTGGDGSVIKGGVVAAAAAATASVVAATVAAGVAETPVEQQTPTPNVESVVVSQEATSTQQQQCPSSVESVEMRLHQNEEEVVATESAAAEEVASSQQPSSDIIQQIEQVEQIEKIEQVVNVEHVVEEILPPTTTTTTTTEEEVVTTPTQEEQVLIEQPQEHQPPVENQSQEEEGDAASSNNYAHESPNLSPVKKDFPTLNHSQHVEAPESTSESAVVNEIHEHHHHEEPVVEEQLTSEAVTTNDIEIVSGNLNGDAALEEVSEQLRAANEDVMTRSFIEDASNPASNPFAAPLIPTTNGENGEQTNGVQTNGTNGNHHLDESCDLNRTHELFEGDESSSSLLSQQAPSQTNGNGVHGDGSVGEEINGGTNGTNGTNGLDKHEESLISSLEALKLANQSANHHVEATNGAGEPHTWNLLELPKPVNPADNGVIDPSNVDLVHDVEIDSKPDATSSPAGGQQSVSAAIGSDKKPIANGKGSGKAPNRNSVDPSSKPATQNNNTNSNSAPSKPSKPIHPAYVELAYIPAHGAESHVDAEFFKRVRARHYVLSALEPNEHALNALCEGKEVWEDKQLSVTLVPTYESEALRKWFMVNEERLQRLKIDITPAAQHANITIDDNPDLSCQVYKLEF